MEFFKTYTDEMHHDNSLLQTIRIPKNLLFLTDRLPQANYGANAKNKTVDKKKKVIQTEISKDQLVPEQKKEKRLDKSPKEENKKSLQQILLDNDDDKKSKEDVVKIKDSSSPGKYTSKVDKPEEKERGREREKEKDKEREQRDKEKEKDKEREKEREREKEKEKMKEDKERRNNNVNKIYQINHPNYGSQELLPTINKGGNYQYNNNNM
jgi:hypothetical protein